MDTRTASLSLALLLPALLAPGTARADIFDDLKKKMEEAPKEVVFPDPQDEALARIKYEADQVLWLFRAARASAHRKATEGGVDTLLAEALAQKHADHAWRYTKRLRRDHEAGKGRRIQRLRELLGSPPQPEDVAAFTPVLARLPEELRSSLTSFEAAAQAAAGRLSDPAALADYVARCEATSDFYRRRGWLARQGKKVARGLDGLIDRLEVRFSRENLARFFARLAGASRFDVVRGRSREALAKLLGRLQETIVRDLDDQLDGGLAERVQEIAVGGGYIQTKTALTRGRLRVLMKLMASLDRPQDLRLFLPTLKAAHRAIKQRRRASGLAEDARKYLKSLDEMLDLAVMVHERKARGPDAPEARLEIWGALWQALRAADFEGIFAELEDDPDLF